MLSSDWDNESSLAKFLDEGACNRTADLELFTDNSSGDTKDFGYRLEHSFELRVLEENGVVKLFLDLNFSPALLLGLGSLASSFLFRQLCTFGCAFRRILATYLCLFSL